MKELETILGIVAHELPAKGVEALLIGGFAVNHYGYTRNTLDIDFMAVGKQIDVVRPILRDAGFINVAVENNVVFFSSPTSSFRIDFLKVDESTMHHLLARAVTISLHGYSIRVPALEDLLAMKVFSLSQNPSGRMGKDLPDITFLVTLHGVDMELDVRRLCQKFGTDDVYEWIRRNVDELRKP